MKICIKCKEEKELILFQNRKKNTDGKNNTCKFCEAKTSKEYRLNNLLYLREARVRYKEKNKDKITQGNKKYKAKNKDKISKTNKIYYEANKLKCLIISNNYKKRRRKIDPLFKLTETISKSISSSIRRRGYTKKSRSFKILGCSYEEFKLHLETQFTSDMNWENQGKWHLDHIYPVSLAKDEEELIKLNHYTNFQPLWAADNLKKGNRIIEKQLILI
jgi:hypothetical protein